MALNIAHRGARSLAPENTLAAARRALEVGADLWETDVAVTRDGYLILFHDDSLVRTTDARDRFPGRSPWTFTSFLLEEIKTLDAGSWFVNTDPFGQIASGAVKQEQLVAFAGEKIPTIEEALIFTQEAGFCVNLELKRLPAPLDEFPVVEQVLTLIDRLKIDNERVIISSFHHPWLNEVRERNPRIEIQALIGYSECEPLDWGAREFKTYNARSTLIREDEIRAAVRAGFTVNLFTVNEEEDMRRFLAAGVEGLITDFPQRAARVLGKP
ncbi:MAG: glycerophosphodiester phosphodiesterase family protein [Desulfomonilia bacterium]|nr:glycerophosphodiester phosphodiesterase family protein [Desulfomonilia bacterium]